MHFSRSLRALALVAVFTASGAFAQTQDRVQPQPEKAQFSEFSAQIEQFYPQIISSLNSNDFDTARELIRKAISLEPDNPLHYYNLCCIESRAGNKSVALAALQNAVDLGYNDIELMNRDTDLANIRKEAEYKRLYQIVANNALAQKEGGGPEVADIYKLDPKEAVPGTDTAGAKEPAKP
jgi:Flp pilus assembly protein TadD